MRRRSVTTRSGKPASMSIFVRPCGPASMSRELPLLPLPNDVTRMLWLMVQSYQVLSVLTQDHFDGLGIQARLLDMVDDALLAQQAIIAGEQDAIGADEAGYRWKYVVMVEIDGSSSIIPHVCGDALDFWHEGIERESAAPVRCDEA